MTTDFARPLNVLQEWLASGCISSATHSFAIFTPAQHRTIAAIDGLIGIAPAEDRATRHSRRRCYRHQAEKALQHLTIALGAMKIGSRITPPNHPAPVLAQGSSTQDGARLPSNI